LQKDSLIGENKKKLRKKLLAKRRALPESERKVRSEKICREILSSEKWKNAEIVAGFMPMPDEVQILPLLEAAISSGKKVVLPVVSGKNLEWREVIKINKDKHFLKGHFGILEPSHVFKKWNPRFDRHSVLWLVPGVGFDKNGNRLGMGGGYYDRTFGAVELVPGTVGVVFSCQIVEKIPTKSWDTSVEAVVSG